MLKMMKAAALSAMVATGAAAVEIPDEDREQYAMAEALYFEARGETDEAQMWIGAVIMNRVRQQRYPNTIEGVVHEYKIRRGRKICQFSYYCDGKSDRMVNREEYKRAWINAGWIIARDTDPTNGADHYFNPRLAMPNWAESLTDIKIKGGHIFGSLNW